MINQKTLDKFYKKYKLVDIELQTGDILFFIHPLCMVPHIIYHQKK